jgi:hypothetical protein
MSSNRNLELELEALMPPGISVKIKVLERKPKDVKTIYKVYGDGRILQMRVVDDDISEKRMTYHLPKDGKALKVEKEKGATISFKWHSKNGMESVFTYFGVCLVGKMFTLTKECKRKFPHLFQHHWREELQNDISPPRLDLSTVELQDGYSAEASDNLQLKQIFERKIDDAIAVEDENEKESATASTSENDSEAGDEPPCIYDDCGDTPCVWLSERDAIIEVDREAHAGTDTPNRTRRRRAFQHMYRVRKGIGRTGVRERHPQCVEDGIRALFPSENGTHMGYREA